MRIAVSIILLLMMSACESPDLRKNPEQVALGKKIYKANCAVCHGTNGEGHKQWRIRDAQGLFRPPPLNGSGHTWHHPKAQLVQMIRDGSPQGKGNMPAWGSKLNEKEILAVIAYIQSLWPERNWKIWREIDQRNR